jgi:protein-tyrosine-phosphatase
MHYQQFSTEKYREAAYKVNAYFNPQYDQKEDKKITLVVSMEALHIHSRKPIKNSNNYDDGAIKNS